MLVHLIDGTYELFRHFYGLRRVPAEKRRRWSAAAGVMNSVLELIEQGATHIGVATDHVIESFRNDLWTGYKTSAGIDPELFRQFHPLERGLVAMGVTTWPMVELEADDALCSAAVKAAADAAVEKVCIWTLDKDLAQCVVADRKLTRSNPQGHNATRLKRLNAKASTELSADTTLDLQAAFVEGVNEVPFTESSQVTFPDMRIRDYFLAGKWTTQLSPNHELQLAVNHTDFGIDWRWITCPPTATFLPEMYELWRVDPSYASAILAGKQPQGGTPEADALAAAAITAIRRLGARARAPTCVAANHDIYEERTDFELQDTLVMSDRLRVVSGLGARRQRVRSPTLFGKVESGRLFRLFANAEVKAVPWLHLNVGGYGEHEAGTGWTWSPRAAINARLTDTQSIRMVLSKGTRTPDLYEQRADWKYHVSGATPPLNGATDLRFFQSAQSPGGLRPERIVSRELGYMLMVPRLGMSLDAKLFDDRLDHLISEKLQAADFKPTNRNRVRLRGAELQTAAELGGGWNGFVNYAFLRNSASSPLEQTHYSRHSGAAGIGRGKEGGVSWSLAYYGASGDGLGQNSYGRTDFTLAKAITVPSARVRASATLSRLDNKTVTYFRDFGSTLENRYDSRLQLRAQLDVSF
jgi:iron complex outermembrane receptor protein